MFWCINFFENTRDKMLKEQRECESIPFSFFFNTRKKLVYWKVYWKIEKKFAEIISLLYTRKFLRARYNKRI